MWMSIGILIAAAMSGQDPASGTAPEPAPEPRYGRLRAAADAEMARRASQANEGEADDSEADWGMNRYANRPRLPLNQRVEQDCADGARPPDESAAACRERITEAVIRESLARGEAARGASDWTEAEEREWVQAPRRSPIDRLRDCRQSSERSRDGDSSSWSVRCGDQDGPAARALDSVLRGN